MQTKTILTAIIAASAAIPLAANADTVTTNGVTWTYKVNDAAKKTITLGGGTKETTAMPTDTVLDAADIPWSFIINDETYTVTALAAYAFESCDKLTGTLTIPDSVTTTGARAFELCKGLEGVSSLGGINEIPSYMFNECRALKSFTADISKVTKIMSGAFQNCAALEGGLYVPGSTTVDCVRQFSLAKLQVLFFGANTVKSIAYDSTRLLLQGCTSGCKVFVPVKSSWNGLSVGNPTINEVIYYGASTNLNLVVDDAAKTITATPTDETALVKVLESAPLFKTHFGWNTRVNITNTIETTAGTITAAMLNAVEFNTMLLTFKVNTQAQLDSVLAAVPASTYPLLAIDASDATEELTLPQGREIYVRVSGDGKQGKYRPKINGLIISFH